MSGGSHLHSLAPGRAVGDTVRFDRSANQTQDFPYHVINNNVDGSVINKLCINITINNSTRLILPWVNVGRTNGTDETWKVEAVFIVCSHLEKLSTFSHH